MENQYSSHIKVFQSDGGTEFTSTCFKTHLRISGIHHQLSCPYTPAQNGRDERKHRHVTETGSTLLFHSHLSPRFWVDAFSTTTYIINRLPTPLLGGKSTFELLYGYSPHYDNFHPFGCRVCPYLRDYMPNKLSPRSIPCIFWVIVLLIKGSAVLIPPPLSYISPAILNLMKLTFLLSLAPRPNLFPLFIFQISSKHIFIILIHPPPPPPLHHHTFLDPVHSHVIFVLTLWMSLCRLILLVQVLLCHSRLLIQPLLKLRLIPLFWALIL